MRLNILILCLFATSYSYAAETTPTDIILNGDGSATDSIELEVGRLQHGLTKLDNDVKAISEAEANLAKAGGQADFDTVRNLQEKQGAAWKQLFHDESVLKNAEFPLLRSQSGFDAALERHIKANDLLAQVKQTRILASADLEWSRRTQGVSENIIQKWVGREQDMKKWEDHSIDLANKTRQDLGAIVKDGNDAAKWATRVARLKTAGKVAVVGGALAAAGALEAYFGSMPGSDSKVGSQDTSMVKSLKNLASDPKTTDVPTHNSAMSR